jgi:hypothetical protein
MFNPDCVSEVSTDHGSASITSVIDSINGSVEIPDGASLVTTAQRALRVLYGILAITNSGEEKYWHQIFPQKSVTEACAGIVDFLAEQLPTILESVDEKVECVPLSSQRTAVSPSGPGNKPSPVSVTFDFLHRFADNLEIEHAKRTNSGPMSAAAASTLTETVSNACFNHFQAISNHSTANCVTSNNTRLFSSNVNSEMDSRGAAEFDTAGNDALQQRLRLSIKQKSDEISDIEAKILGGAKGNERTALEIRVKQLERSLLNDKIDLSVAASSGEFQAHVNKLHGQVVEVTTRQDKLEERQNEVEQKVQENEAATTSELRTICDRLLELESAARTAKEERAAFDKKLEAVQNEQHHTRRAVDVVDNRQRKQNLVLFGLEPSEPVNELRKILPETLSSGIDRVFPITQPDKNGRVGFSVQFKTVSSCEQTFSYLISREFKLKRPHITTAQDESELLRVGGSRMRAIATFLRNEYDGIHIGRDFVRLGKEKISASEFALSKLRLGDKEIDIDAAVSENPDAQVNPGLRTYAGGREINGIRLPRKRKHSEESESNPVAGTRSRAGRQPNKQAKKNNTGGRSSQRGVSNTLPTLDGQSSGGVTFFNRGHAAHGGGHSRDNVMRVSPRTLRGQPAYLFWH